MKLPPHLVLLLAALAFTGVAAEPDPREWAATSSLEAAVLTREADHAWQAGRAEEAGKKFAAAVARDPQALRARLSLGDLHLAAGRADEAEREWRSLVGEGDRDPRLPHRLRAVAAIRLGNLLRDQGRDQAALYFYSKPVVWDQSGGSQCHAYYVDFANTWKAMHEIHTRTKSPGYGSMYLPLQNLELDLMTVPDGALGGRYRQSYPNLGLLEVEEATEPPTAPATPSWAGRITPEDLPGTIPLPTGGFRLGAEFQGAAVWVLPLVADSPPTSEKHPEPIRLDCASGARVTLPASKHRVVSVCGLPEGMLLVRWEGTGEVVDAAGKILRTFQTHVNSVGQVIHCPRTGRVYGTNTSGEVLYQIHAGRGPEPLTARRGTAGSTWAIDPARGLLYGMVTRHNKIWQHAALTFVGRTLPEWWGPHREGPCLVAYAMGRQGELFPVSVRALPTLAPGGTLSLSSDGNELTVAGGGGSPMFDGTEVRTRRDARSYFRRHFIDLPAAYPAGRPDLIALGAWHHPFAPVVAVLDGEGISFHPRGASAEPVRFGGSFLPGGVWTADGTRFLALRRGSGEAPPHEATPVAFRVTLRPEDLAAGKARQDQLASWAAANARENSESPAPAAPPAHAFPVTTNLVEAVAAFHAALATPGDRLLPDWRGVDGYARAPANPSFNDVLDVSRTLRPGDEPFGLVRAKKWFAEGKPPYAPAHYVRGTLRVAPSQRGAAIADFLEAARLDAATTSLSRLSLLAAARRAAADNQDALALSCYAAAITLDAPSPALLEEMAPLLARHGLKADGRAAEMAARAGTGAQPPPARPRVAIRLPPPSAAPAVAPTPGDLHARARRATATGWVKETPFCAVLIDTDGHLLTALDGLPGSGEVELTFAPGSDAHPSAPVRAEILRRDAPSNLALLRARSLPPGAAPLELADAIPPAGTRVHALSGADPRPDATQAPGLSAGIISGPPRLVDGVGMLQHSAAVNRHGVGGPVLDPAGRLVGLSARDSHLENVAFALPATRLRAWLRDTAPEEKP